MPRQNRVTPWGEIVAAPNRGLFMGNRGCIHDSNGSLTGRYWARKAWVTCLLSFKDRKRKIMTPGMYTELFFLDEATALAAGHRPCATCRRVDYARFKKVWSLANGKRLGLPEASIADIDDILHMERVDSSGLQNTWQYGLRDLPDGVFVVLDDPEKAFLVWGKHLLEWSSGGYCSRKARPVNREATVLTPRSIVEVIAAGYEPELHFSTQQFR